MVEIPPPLNGSMPLDFGEAEGWDEVRYAAEMEARQFHALAIRLDKAQLIKELPGVDRLQNPRLGKTAKHDTIRRWLKNGWNTELILRLTAKELDDEALSAALQWSFPMAYYAAFAVTSAFFEAASYTEKSHASILKRFGKLVVAGRYPKTISFSATGTKKNLVFHNIQKPTDAGSAIRFVPDDEASVDKHVCQFLKATRERLLKEKKEDFKFRTIDGRRKQRLSEDEWEKVAASLGPTSILSLLYRKRIKAHYREIDSFADTDVDSEGVFSSLIHVVDCINLAHEALIAAGLGVESYRPIAESFAKPRDGGFLLNRLEQVATVVR